MSDESKPVDDAELFVRAEEAAMAALEPKKETDAESEPETADEPKAEDAAQASEAGDTEAEAAPEKQDEAKEPKVEDKPKRKQKADLSGWTEQQKNADFATLTRRQRQLEAREQEHAAQLAQYQQERAQVQQLAQLARDNPVTLMKKLAEQSGMTEVELLNNLQHRYANQNQPHPKETENALLQRLDRMERMLTHNVQQQQTVSYQREIEQARQNDLVELERAVAEMPQHWGALSELREADPEAFRESLSVALALAEKRGGMDAAVLLDMLDESESKAYQRAVARQERARGVRVPSRKAEATAGSTARAPGPRNGNGSRPVVDGDRALTPSAARDLSEEERILSADAMLRRMLNKEL